MHRIHLATGCFMAATLLPQLAQAVSSAELYTATAYSYGRVETRLRFAAGDGVVSSFFLWKDGSEQAGAFWNELDDEKVGADCRLESNPIYGMPSANHSQRQTLALDLCGAFHTYAYEWTPDAIVWRVDDQEIRRETGATAQAFADNAGQPGMQIHLNLWPGDASFGGNFDPATLPVHEYVDWVQFSAYENGDFKLSWRENFDGSTLPEGWLTGTWASPKNLSTHASENVSVIGGYAVLSLTTDDARGPAGAMPGDSGGSGASNGGSGASPSAGAATSGGSDGSAAGSGGVATNATSGSSNASSSGGTSSATAGASSDTDTPSAPGKDRSSSGNCNFGRSSHDGWWSFVATALAYLLVRRRQ
jgi:endo-1,3-1,4-beta-glycanase ExoK